MKQMGFVAAMRDYFGYLPKPDGQPGTAADFLSELKKLTDEDRLWFRENLPKVGYEITS